MPICIVPGCGRGPSSQVRLHSTPKVDTTIYQIWKERIANPRLEDNLSKSKYFVCDRHFIKECQSPGTKRLRKFSLPSVNCPGFNETPTIANSFLYPPKQLTPFLNNTPVAENTSVVVEIKNENGNGSTEKNILSTDDSVQTNGCGIICVEVDEAKEKKEFQVKTDLDADTVFPVAGRNKSSIKGNKDSVKGKNDLEKLGPYPQKLINLARKHWIPRRLNIDKPVGFSNRQKLAWKIRAHFKREIKKRNILNKIKSHKKKNNKKIDKVTCEIESCDSSSSPTVIAEKFHQENVVSYDVEQLIKSDKFHIISRTICGLHPLAAQLLSLQMKRELLPKVMDQFTTGENLIAFTLYKKLGAKKYQMLSEHCALPPPDSLYQFVRKIPCLPGFHKQVFHNIKSSTLKMEEADKYCSVIFQEIPLELEYQHKNVDQMEFELDDDLMAGQLQDENIVGDHVILVMLRGLNRDWRQAVTFQLTKGKISAQDLTILLKRVIREALDAGLRVVATIFNKRKSYIETVSILSGESPSLLQQTRGVNVTEEMTSPFLTSYQSDLRKNPVGLVFVFNNHEISLIYNPTNLLRIVRSKWMTYDISFVDRGKIKEASWNYVSKLYAIDYEDANVKICPKLTTNNHINMEQIDTQSCAQIFSQTVSSVLKSLVKLKVDGFDRSAMETADLILFFDKLFDSVNATCELAQNGKPLRSPVYDGSPHKDFWKSATSVLSTMRFLTPFKHESDVFELWSQTLASINRLCDILIKDKHLKNIYLGHLNNDPLENFIKIGLMQDVYCVRPTFEIFLDSFKQLLLCGDYFNDTNLIGYQNGQLDPFRQYVYDELT